MARVGSVGGPIGADAGVDIGGVGGLMVGSGDVGVLSEVLMGGMGVRNFTAGAGPALTEGGLIVLPQWRAAIWVVLTTILAVSRFASLSFS